MLFGLYLLVRFGTCLIIPKIIVSIFGLFLLDLTWYIKFLSFGPVLFFIFAFGALIVWVWEKKFLIFMLVLYFLNIVLLFLIEYNSTGFEFQYASLQARTSDIYLSFTLYLILLIFILIRVKKDFLMQKENAIRSDKLKTAFLANLSHEIRTPMNSIVGFSNLIEQNPDPKTIKKYIGNIKHSSESLLRLINEILDLSKIEAGYSDIYLTDFSILKLFDEIKNIFLIEIARRDKHKLKIRYHLPEEDLIVRSDYLILSQILSILLNNAIKFSSEGEIIFSCDLKNDKLQIAIKDNGPGIPEESQSQIFDRFTKFDHNGVNTEGSGIGLSIAQKLVGLLQGDIWVYNNMDGGATFIFTIPYIKASKESAEIKEKIKTDSNMNYIPGNNVLVVEDDKPGYLLIREMLRPLKLNLHLVTDGKDAIDFVKSNPSTKLILMDLKLPFMDGYEATRRIKETNPNIIIIAQTAYAMQGDKEKALGAGCDHYLTKPLDNESLLALVNSCISN